MMFVRTGVAVFVGVVVSVSGAFAEPEVFSDAGFATDQAFAAENQKLHILYFTASWCPPCQKMKETTWVDESVVSWLDENAVVTPIDVDVEKGLAREYRVSAMPTITVFRGEEEIARTVGYTGPVEFRDWLVRAEAGEIKNEMAQEQRREAKRDEIIELLDTAREHFISAEHDAAILIYEDVWQQAFDSDEQIFGPRFIPLVETGIMRALAKRDPHAKIVFTEIRNLYQTRLQSGDVTWELLTCWAALNNIIEDEQTTIAWVERQPEAARNLEHTSSLRYICERAAKQAKRYDVLASMIDPQTRSVVAAQLRALSHPRVGSIEDEEMRAMILKSTTSNFRDEQALFYAVALVQGDEIAAREIAELLLEIDGSNESRIALVAAAEEAGVEPIVLP